MYCLKYECPKCGGEHVVRLKWLPCEDPLEASAGDVMYIEASREMEFLLDEDGEPFFGEDD